MRFRLSGAFALALAGAISISCGGIVDPSQNQVETFSGTMSASAPSGRSFSSPKTGEIQIKMLTLTPASVPYVGVQWVQASGDGNCNGGLLQLNQFATANTTAISGQIVSGNYCVIVYDTFGLSATQTVNYSLTVSHP